jgi:hypothetical protein
MRCARVSLLLCFALLNVSAWAQQTASPQQVPATQAIRDPQALSVLNQALTAAGGVSAIAAITDYTATGTITYNNNSLEQGNVTLQGLGLIGFRMDANLSAGVRSLAMDQGEVSQKAEDGTVSHPHTQAPMFPGGFLFPYLHLANALKNPTFGISYGGLLQLDDHSVYEIRVQRIMPPGIDPLGLTTAFRTREFFIDATTFQVLMTRESSGRNHAVRQVRYSDYKVVNSALVPFSINEEIVSLQSFVIHLDHITFNTGIQESAFIL